jgi:hypothetical protein
MPLSEVGSKAVTRLVKALTTFQFERPQLLEESSTKTTSMASKDAQILSVTRSIATEKDESPSPSTVSIVMVRWPTEVFSWKL